jgi:hypothetical protein
MPLARSKYTTCNRNYVVKHQLLVCAYYSNFWVKRAITMIEKTTDALFVTSYKVALGVNAEETK